MPASKTDTAFGKRLPCNFDELLGQGQRGFLTPDLEDRLEVLCDLGHRRGQHIALEVDDAPLPACPGKSPEDGGLYSLVVVGDYQAHALQPSGLEGSE
jgi:hypothetical protein